MKRIIVGVAAVAILAVIIAVAVVYINQRNRMAAEKVKQEAEQAEKDRRNAERDAKAQAANAPSFTTPDPVAGNGALTDTERCQLEKVVADQGKDKAWELFQQWAMDQMTVDDPNATLPEAIDEMGSGPTFSEFLAGRGYTC